MRRKIIIIFSSLFLLFTGTTWAQNYNNNGYKFSDHDLKNLIAPIALYPDPLLAQVLTASTYPLEIVEARRIIHSDKDFTKIDSQNWDPSVKEVAHYPAVLKMMNDRLGWTQQLGQAVIAQQPDVLRAIQERREEAQRIGNLKSTPQQKVRQTGNAIEIIPADPEIIYLPVYDPVYVYTSPTFVSFVPLGFGVSFTIGSGGWFTGFYWPDYAIVYNDPYYYGWNWGWWGWPHSNFSVRNFSITNIVRNTFTVNPMSRAKWTHDERHGNPFNGRATSPTWLSKKEISSMNNLEHQRTDIKTLDNRNILPPKGQENGLTQTPKETTAPHSKAVLRSERPNQELKNVGHPSTLENRQTAPSPMRPNPTEPRSPGVMGGTGHSPSVGGGGGNHGGFNKGSHH